MSAKQDAGDRSTGKRRGTPRPGCGGAREGAGRKPWAPSQKQREYIEILVATVPRIEDVAGALGVSVDTLRKACPDELRHGKTRKNGAVVHSLYLNATVHNNVSAQIYWTKTQMGWKEIQRLEHTGKDGEAITYEERLKQIHASADA
jgi:hypothetical protein